MCCLRKEKRYGRSPGVGDTDWMLILGMWKPEIELELASGSKMIRDVLCLLMGELRAVLYGMYQCIEEEVSHVTDSLLAVHVLAEEDGSKSVLCEHHLFKALCAKGYISACYRLITCMRREANKAAHTLASFAKNLETMCVWHENLPSWLADIVWTF